MVVVASPMYKTLFDLEKSKNKQNNVKEVRNVKLKHWEVLWEVKKINTRNQINEN